MIRYANVVIPPLETGYTYELPASLAQIDIGWRVEVPLGKRTATGYVTEVYPAAPKPVEGKRAFQIKSVVVDGDHAYSFNQDQLTFFRWAASYYCEALSTVIDTAIPRSLSAKITRTVQLNPTPPPTLPKARVQKEILAFLHQELATRESIEQREILKRFKSGGASLKKLVELGYLQITEDEIFENALHGEAPAWAKTEISLNAAQQTALETISSGSTQQVFSPVLLHGVTGSGKTEVYIEAARYALSQGRSVLIIVPEIALTPQLVDRFHARLGSNIAVLHSALSTRIRWNSWRALLEGRSQIALGARSAVFAPMTDLGLIIVDEEHDHSYKQSDGFRYHARDLALVRGKLFSCPVVLGSATPSIETFHNALTKKYAYIPLSGRHETSSSFSLEIVDLNQIKPWEMASSSISPLLHDALKEIVAKNEQAFVLYNRRGFASYLQCEKCDEVLVCPNCSVTMTFHQDKQVALCHYCNLSILKPEVCTTCVEKDLRARQADPNLAPHPPGALILRGGGTEKVFEELKGLFPQVLIERLDRDTAENHSAYRAILDRVRSGETKILVGTQMIAKGHDLPGVTLVGVADCDVGIHMPDFRSAERAFQLLTQAAGRSGRGMKAGRVLLQTRVPKHISIVKTRDKDFIGFAEAEIQERRDLGYPPFFRLARVIASSQERHLPMEILQQYKEIALELGEDKVRVLGPSPAPLQKLKTLWRSHLLLKSVSSTILNRVIQTMQRVPVTSTRLKIAFDIDPQEMM